MIFTADVQLYPKISFGADYGTTVPPGPPFKLRLVGGNCAYVARGIDAPGAWSFLL